MDIGAFIQDLTNGNDPSNATVAANQAEENGNSDDLLFRTSQPALGIGIGGGTTLTNISPYTALQDLTAGKLSLAAIVWLVLGGLLLYWVMKNK